MKSLDSSSSIPAEMLALVYHGPRDLRVETVATPDIGPGEMLLKVSAASICGTDLRILHGDHRKYPAGTIRIPGHEVAGTIAGIGEGVQGWTTGQKVFVAPNMGCGHCPQCISGNNNRCANYHAIGITIDGGFAEYMRIPAKALAQGDVLPIREEVEEAVAALTEPFACVLRGQRHLNIQAGDVVLVMGAGPIGIMHAKLARLQGAGCVIVSEPNPERLAEAEHLGADCVVNPAQEELAKAVDAYSRGRGADVVIVAAPAHAAQEAALQVAAIGGRISFFGGLPKDRPKIQFDSNLVHYKELLVSGTTACSTADCAQAAEILNSGRIDLSALVTHRFPLREGAAAFEAAESGRALKVVLEP
jgi:L-iditol 2-dehydrogenase